MRGNCDNQHSAININSNNAIQIIVFMTCLWIYPANQRLLIMFISTFAGCNRVAVGFK